MCAQTKEQNVTIELILAILHFFNAVVHTEPFSFVIDGIYWWFVLFVLCPIGGFFQSLRTIFNIIIYALGLYNPVIEYDVYSAANSTNTKELAVLVTGCDSGFGQEFVLEMAKKYTGFTVFAGCLKEESFEQFKGFKSVIPLKIDVTNDDDVSKAYGVVDKWLKQETEEQEEQKERYLHAVINNAGIVTPGLVDWLEVSDFHKVMDVNYYGMIRVIKAYLPILKRQAKSQYKDSRIINVISSAGLVTPMPLYSTYGASKFAAEALTTNLRQEMSMFNIKVVGINPTFHATDMHANMKLFYSSAWNKLPSSKQEEYGSHFIKHINDTPTPPAWHSAIAVNEMVKATINKNPNTRMLVGLDAKFTFHLVSKLPIWFTVPTIDYGLPILTTPASMMTKADVKDTIDMTKKED